MGEPASEPPASSSWWDADAAEPEPIEWRQNARGNLWTLIDDMHTAIFHNRYNEEE